MGVEMAKRRSPPTLRLGTACQARRRGAGSCELAGAASWSTWRPASKEHVRNTAETGPMPVAALDLFLIRSGASVVFEPMLPW